MATKKAKGPGKKSAGKGAKAAAKAKPKAKQKATAQPKAASKPKPAKKAAAKRRAAGLTARAKPETLRLRSVAPIYTVNDVEKSLAFYRDVLGFSEGERWIVDGQLAGIDLVAGTSHFMIGQDDWKKGRDRVKGVGFRVYCSTIQSVDDLARRIKERGVALDMEPTDQAWGREIALTDPDGFKITIVQEAKKR